MPTDEEVSLFANFSEKFQNANWPYPTTLESRAKIDISIICLTYNHRAFIERTLFSFLNQKSSASVEILIFDDCSTDGTIELLNAFSRSFPNLISLHIHEYNKFSVGESNITEIFEKARGRYIAYTEGDDYWLSETKLEDQFSLLEANPSLALVYGSALFIDEFDALIPIYSNSSNYADMSASKLESGANIFTLTSMFRNNFELPENINGKNIYLDILLWSICGERGAGHFMRKLPASAYRVHSNGLNSGSSQQKRNRMLKTTYWLMLLRKVRKIRVAGFSIALKLCLLVARDVIRYRR